MHPEAFGVACTQAGALQLCGLRVQGRPGVLPSLAARAAAAGHHGRGGAAQELPRAH